MLSKTTFCNIIKEIKKVNNKLDKLQDANPQLTLSIVEEYSLQDTLISLLEECMGISADSQFGSTISWWIYETNFGKDGPNIRIDNDDKTVEYCLDTAEKLYNFCILESGQK